MKITLKKGEKILVQSPERETCAVVVNDNGIIGTRMDEDRLKDFEDEV